MEVFVSWSGGKDCCLALYRAKQMGLDVKYLASMITEGTGRLWPHWLSPEVLWGQADALGIQMMQEWTNVKNYDSDYQKMILALKEGGVEGAVFGDVNIGNSLARKHRGWVEGVCRATGIKHFLPLWQDDRETLIREFIEAGFKAVIIAADNGPLGKEWLGRELDKETLAEFKRRHQESPTGEVGYYHTFVIDGPIFKKRLEILDTDVIFEEPFWFLNITGVTLRNKETL